ncbi:hypothetical protein LCGC14_1819570 [marine sediment metagenome]|uniref:Uncharacterized protein n=1 Tax=marine sediment metagenome TaxID=412755 RepID=A0A0F9JIV9_9ZZZZ
MTLIESMISALENEGYLVIKKEKITELQEKINSLDSSEWNPPYKKQPYKKPEKIRIKGKEEKEFETKTSITQAKILTAIKNGWEWFTDIQKETKIGSALLGNLLKSLVKKGLLHSPSSGQYLLVEGGPVSKSKLSEVSLKRQKKVVYDALVNGATNLTEATEKTGLKKGSVSSALTALIKRGLVIRVQHGTYALANKEKADAPQAKPPDKSVNESENEPELEFPGRD